MKPTAEQLAEMLRLVVDAYCDDVHLGYRCAVIEQALNMLKAWDKE